MARIEKIDLKRQDGKANLIPSYAFTVHVASFRFGFGSIQQLKECIDYFSRKTHPSSRIPAKVLAAGLGEDWRELRGWDVERWFERLPMYLLEEPKRQKVIKALTRALELAEKDKILPLTRR
jgi:hypothetical protein